MKKRILTLLLVFCMISGTVAFTANTTESADAAATAPEATDITNVDIDIIVSDISTVISDYYHAKDISESFNPDDSLNDDIALYLADKVNTQNHIDSLYGLGKENYNVDVISHDYSIDANSNIISFEFQALTTYNYADCDFDTTVSDVVYVKYDVGKQKIVDVYIPFNYYDEFVRSEEPTVDKVAAYAENDNTEFELTPSIIAKQKELHSDIDVQYDSFLSE